MTFWKSITLSGNSTLFSHALWCSGQFETIIGLAKQAFFKAIGKTKLTCKELNSVIYHA